MSMFEALLELSQRIVTPWQGGGDDQEGKGGQCQDTKTPGQDCPEETGLGREIKNFGFYLLMVVKSFIFLYKMCWLATRYHRTVGKWNTFEIWFCALTALKVAIILPLYFLRDLNMLYLVFVLNSLGTYALSHVLRLRACVALNLPRQKVQWQNWMFFIQFGNVVFWLLVAPFLDQTQSYNLLIYCNISHVYPFRFVVIFGLDLLHALIELKRTIRAPTFQSEKDRIKRASLNQLLQVRPKRNGSRVRHTKYKTMSISSMNGIESIPLVEEDHQQEPYSINAGDLNTTGQSAQMVTYEEDVGERRETLENLHVAKFKAKQKGEFYQKHAFFDLAPKAPQRPLTHMKSEYGLSAEQHHDLNEMEHWHFLSVQQWILTLGNIVMALFQVLVFGLAVFANDFNTDETPVFITNFAFECAKGYPSRWWIGKTSQSEMMYELHPIILHMYVTLAMITLNTIPFKYDRLSKTMAEKELERKAKEKRQRTKARKKTKKAFKKLPN